jgi:hypothetical protein
MKILSIILIAAWAVMFYDNNRGREVSEIPFGFILFVLSWIYILAVTLLMASNKKQGKL